MILIWNHLEISDFDFDFIFFFKDDFTQHCLRDEKEIAKWNNRKSRDDEVGWVRPNNNYSDVIWHTHTSEAMSVGAITLCNIYITLCLCIGLAMCAASENAFTLTVLLLSVRQTDSVRHQSPTDTTAAAAVRLEWSFLISHYSASHPSLTVLAATVV